jgi:hypothetical protein
MFRTHPMKEIRCYYIMVDFVIAALQNGFCTLQDFLSQENQYIYCLQKQYIYVIAFIIYNLVVLKPCYEGAAI